MTTDGGLPAVLVSDFKTKNVIQKSDKKRHHVSSNKTNSLENPMQKKSLLVILLLVLTSGCAITPNPEAMGPFPNDYKEIVMDHVLHTYFDPYSIRSASISYPAQGHIVFQQGWIVCLESNAKNKMGGYIGLQRTAYLLHEGSIVREAPNAPLCNDSSVYYDKWPELEQIK